ncbi:unnamed protein product (macronuclear) [Paramecium tetraurelia]|uniref:Uncharacterized protein n=1 Tax=Paramecium tetraurelia TaxID=5888 RepID=A0E4G6_PARTE|nr:uncharacterized protein GSPATT00023358001 [Paramecium tetraurelia]CAK90183.1 unnamed protein product [Paramecium tetraurelia]|eukprot:XP_001457580.1 hypothetical protein (macronuclear) [Paramecium tetraurelia strain d4-2]
MTKCYKQHMRYEIDKDKHFIKNDQLIIEIKENMYQEYQRIRKRVLFKAYQPYQRICSKTETRNLAENKVLLMKKMIDLQVMKQLTIEKKGIRLGRERKMKFKNQANQEFYNLKIFVVSLKQQENLNQIGFEHYEF